MVFNIGKQTGGIINNVEGDQHIHDGQSGLVAATEDARQAVRDLRAAVATAGLDQQKRAAISAHLDEMEQEVEKPSPDRSRVAASLEKAAGILASAGSIAKSGSDLAGPIQTLISWLGTMGQNIAQALF